MVIDGPRVRFYAGMPLTTPEGLNVGTLCVVDTVPRVLSEQQRETLRVLGRQVVAQLLLRRQVEEMKAVVAERERVERERRASDEQFRRLVEDSPIGIYRTTPDGQILLANPAAVQLAGAESFEALSKRNLEKDGPHCRYSRAEFKRRLEAEGEVRGLETEWIGDDGRTVHLRENARLVRDARGEVYYEGTLEDVTDRKRAEAALTASEARFRAFMDGSPASAFMKDEAGRYTYVNEPVVRRFGRPVADWLGRTDEELFPKEYSAAWRENDRTVLAGGRAVEFEESAPLEDGSLSHWSVYKFPFQDGSVRFLAGIALDVTEKRATELALRASEAKFRATLDRLAEGVFVVDVATRRFVDVNATALAMLGYSAGEFFARTPYDLSFGETPESYERSMEQVRTKLSTDGRCDLGRRQFRRKDGTPLPVDLKVTFVPNGGAGLYAVIARDVTEQAEYEDRLFEYQSQLEEANAKLKRMATTDALTGAKNRAAFNERLAEEYDRANRHGHPLSVIMLDVDHFKLFNDSFGHPAGDDVLKNVAAALQKTARVSDFVARYGGEEFVLLLPDSDYAGAMVLAERCRRAVAGHRWDKRAITISVGVSTLTADLADARALVQEADVALYRSKQAGRNRISHGSGSVPMMALSRS